MSSLYPKAIELADAIAAQETEDAQLIHDLTTELEDTKVQLAFATGIAESQATTIRGLQAKIAELEAIIADLTAEPEPEEPPVVVPPVTTGKIGPTGKHWPQRTPKLTDTVDLLQEAGTIAQLQAAINKANLPENIGKTARINYTAHLTGFGGGATNTPVLQNIGVANRAGGRILITPKGGIGSLNIISSSARFYKVRGVAFVGFHGWAYGQAQADAKGVLVSGVEDFAWAWSKSRYANITGTDKESNVEFCEVVAPESHLWPAPPSGASDRWQWKNGSAILGTTYARVIGCYLAPVRTQNGDAAHLDALQIFNQGKWDVFMEDSVVFSATNQGFITTNDTAITLVRSLIIGGDSTQTRYPLEPNAETAQFPGAPWPVNGTPYFCELKNNSWLISTPKGWKPIYDKTSGQKASLSKAELDAVSDYPTDTYLKQTWR